MSTPAAAPQPLGFAAAHDAEEVARAELLFRAGHNGREVARRINRSYAAVARFMAQRPDVLAASSLF